MKYKKHVQLRKDGRYYIRVQAKNQIFSNYTRDKRKIASIEKELIAKSKQQSSSLKTNFTLYSWLNFWWENYKRPFVDKSSNIPIYINHIKTYFTDNKLENYSTAILQRTLNMIPISRTKELIVLYLGASFKKAVETGVLKFNPFLAVVKDKKLNNKRNAFTYLEQVRIMEAIKGTDIERDIMIYLFTGMRKNEYKPKELISNLDTTHNVLKIECEKKRSSTPVYKYVDLTSAFIDKYILAPRVGELYVPQTIYKHFVKILKQLKIEGGLHTLRHTFSTNYFYMGIPDKMRSEWLGHETVDITQDIYTNIDRSISKEKLLELYGDLLYQI